MARRRSIQTEEVIELTQEAFDDLKAEYKHRTEVEREQIAQEISTARELGDLRENQAYTYAMEKKDRNESRISELEDMIKRAKVISAGSAKVVQIGSTVEIQNLETKQKRTLTLVGAEETQSANPEEGKISIDSPVGKAIFNAKIGDEVEVVLPARTAKYKVLKMA